MNRSQASVLSGFIIAFSTMMAFFVSSRADQVPPAKLDAFLTTHCYDCHDDSVSKGDLNLLDLPFALSDPDNAKHWETVFKRVESGEMPPKKKPRPKVEHKEAFLRELEKPLHAAVSKRVREEGRSKVRRLTRREYEKTIHDLLGIDIPLVEHLPEDAEFHGFETVASVQQLSHFLLEKYLEAAEMALEEAFERAFKGDESFSREINAHMLGRGSWKGGNYRGPEDRDGRAIAWPLNLQFYGRMPATTVPKSGWYRIQVKGVQAVNADVVWGTLRSGACSSSAPVLYPVGLVEATKQKRDLTFEAWIQGRHMLELKPNDKTIPRAKVKTRGGTVIFKGSNLIKDGTQGIAMDAIEITRIYPNANRQAVRKNLVGNITKQQIENASPENLKEILSGAVHRFANRAFRRPVSREVTRPYSDLAIAILNEKDGKPAEALFTAYRAILCSPRFLTFYEKPGRLDQHAVANRLSYMLWNSMPDDQLRSLADDGKLKGTVLHQQFSRMLDDKKSERFIASFTDQWLKLNEIDFTSPDERRFRTFDPVVQESIVGETRSFVDYIIRRNQSIRNLIHSDFAFLNERLNRFYAMKGIDFSLGNGIQKVDLKENLRGGLVTQASILKVTADGTTTSPIIRGVFVSERILGLEIPPPPPGVPAVEPDIRGAVSIRDQLDKHRNNESCAACHAKIDPAGFALENYDPVGLWRNQYGTKRTSAKVNPSGVSPDGKLFNGIRSWKEIYLGQPDQLTKAFATQLLIYATGAKPEFCDRAALDQIVSKTREKNYGMRSLMHAVVASEPFQTK